MMTQSTPITSQHKVLILGAGGLVGSALERVFRKKDFHNLLTPRRGELNLEDQVAVLNYFANHKPDVVIDAAAKVGGIHANNTFRADFIFKNLQIQNNLFKASFENQVKKFLFLGSSCIYPRECPQPIKEEYLLTGPLEPTNEPYAVAKIAGLKTAESFKRQYGVDYFSVMPTNLYGENDNFHTKHGHVLPALIGRMDEVMQSGGKVFEAWGTGSPRREFLYVDDMADACHYLLTTNQELPHWINIGTGEDVTIKELVEVIAEEMQFDGEIKWNTEFPDGTPRKLLDVSALHSLGWKHQIDLRTGIRKTIEYFKKGENIRRY